MLILLPPSEGKTSPARGPKLSVKKLSFPELNPVREDVARALVALCSGPAAKARSTLGLGPTQDAEITRNAGLRSAPCASAGLVYTGVLFDALDYASLPKKAQTNVDAWVAVSSALFGLVRPSDPIPAYRLSADVVLPKIGALTDVWKSVVSATISTVVDDGVLFDLRSGAYVKLGPIPAAIADRSVVGKVLLERNGKRSVVSHANKASKGRLIRALASKGKAPADPVQLADCCQRAGFHVELAEPTKSGKPWTMDIVVTDV